MDKDVFLFFCSTVAQSVAGMLAFFGAFAMFRISEVERTLAQQGEGWLTRLDLLGLDAEEIRHMRDHFHSGRYRAFVEFLESWIPRVPKDQWTRDMASAFGTLKAAKHRRDFIFERGREVLVAGMCAVLAALGLMAGLPSPSVESFGLAVCAVLLIATAWSLFRGVPIVLGRLPET